MAPRTHTIMPSEQWSPLVREGKAQAVPIGRDMTQEYKVEGDKIRDITMSTPTSDRGRDTIALEGWRLDAFKANGVLLWCHDYGMPPIGMVSGVAVEPGRRLFAVEATFLSENLAPAGMEAEHVAFAIMIGKMYLAGMLKGFSIGMMPLRYAWNEERGGVDFLEQELLELSCCSVPMNSECLLGAKSAGITLTPWLAFAEKRLDGDERAPFWLSTRAASTIHRTLSAPAVQVPAMGPGFSIEDAVRRAVGDATREQAERISSLTRTVEALRAPPSAAPPAPVEITEEQIVQAVTAAVAKTFTAVTGILPG
jgi:hypothetical protein